MARISLNSFILALIVSIIGTTDVADAHRWRRCCCQKTSPSVSESEQRMFGGRWRVRNASFQMTGGIIYTFQQSTVIVEHEFLVDPSGPKRRDAKREFWQVKGRYYTSQLGGERLLGIHFFAERDGQSGIWTDLEDGSPLRELWVYEFKEGALWLSDYEGYSVMGLRRVEEGAGAE